MGGKQKRGGNKQHKGGNRRRKEDDHEKEKSEILAEMVSQPPNSPEAPEVTQEEPAVVEIVEEKTKTQDAGENTAEASAEITVNLEKVEESAAVVDEKPMEIVEEIQHVPTKEEDAEDKEHVDEEDVEKVGEEKCEDHEERDKEDRGENIVHVEIPLIPKVPQISHKERTDDEKSSHVSEPEEWTVYEWEKKDEDYNVEQAIFVKSYNRKFAATLFFLNPEFRYAADIGHCESFDGEGVKKLLQKMKEATDIQAITPFDGDAKVTDKELRRFLSEVLHTIKLCLRLACAERGYEYKSGKLNAQPISAVWGDGIDPMAELQTLKAILREMKEPLMKDAAEEQESRFWAETDAIFEKVLPALESFDSKTLSENSITDCMNSIHGRIELGFDITEEEVDKMLERSFSEDGFGEFPPAALYAPQVFKTPNQLKMIFEQLEKMSKVIDIRVKQSGVQMITRIFEIISDDEAALVMEELKGQHPVTIERMFGIDPKKFEFNTNDPKRTQYLKIFFTMLAETPKEEFSFPPDRLIAVLKCLYLVFDPFDVNMIIFKIVATRIRENHHFDDDRRMLIHMLMNLPEPLRKRLEVGPDFSTGDVSDDRESMYYQIKHIICTGTKDHLEKLKCFIAFTAEPRQDRMMSIEKAMRIAIKCIEKGVHQMMAVETLRTLSWHTFMKHKLSNEFFEELLVLALSKYSVPDAKTSEKKYAFIDMVFSVLDNYDEEGLLEIDAQSIMEKWTNMGHPWFSVLYLSHRFPLLKTSLPVPQYPWLSEDAWTDEKKDETDFKNYVPLAKVPTAWPNCVDLKIIEDLVSEHVPMEISRADLYTAMRKYVSESTMDEGWKLKLLNAFENKISFLTSHSKKGKETQSREKKVSEMAVLESKKKEDVLVPVPAGMGESEVEAVVVDKEKESEEKSEKEPAKVKTENPVVETAEIVEVVPQDLLQMEQKVDLVESEKIENDETKEENVVKLKPLREAISEELKFIRYFDSKEWVALPEVVRVEVYRQRKLNGYSNEY